MCPVHAKLKTMTSPYDGVTPVRGMMTSSGILNVTLGPEMRKGVRSTPG